MSNVTVLPVATRHDLNPRQVLLTASDAGLSDAMVMGWNEDGTPYVASSIAHAGEMLILLEIAREKIMDQIRNA